MNMENPAMNWQVVVNALFGLVAFFGGWLIRVNFTLLSKMQEDYRQLHVESKEDYRRLNKDLTSLALSLPEKYTSKEDFNKFLESVHRRFDRIEEKIDELK